MTRKAVGCDSSQTPAAMVIHAVAERCVRCSDGWQMQVGISMETDGGAGRGLGVVVVGLSD